MLVKSDRAFVRGINSRDNVQQRSLAGAIRPHQTEHFTFMSFQAHFAEGNQSAEALAYPLHGKNRFAHPAMAFKASSSSAAASPICRKASGRSAVRSLEQSLDWRSIQSSTQTFPACPF